MSRSATSNLPSPFVSSLSGRPSAVKNASLPTRLRCACVPGAGGALDSMSRVITVLSVRLSADIEVFSSLFT